MHPFADGVTELVRAFADSHPELTGASGNGLAGIMGVLTDFVPDLASKFECRAARECRSGVERADRYEDAERQHAGCWPAGNTEGRTTPTHR